MRIKFVHPLWTHLPAVTIMIVAIVYLIAALPLPDEAPVHFTFNGIPNDYDSPWVVVGLVSGLSLLYITTSIIIDELWARQEKGKTFNWFSIFDEIAVGTIGGILIGYLRDINSSDFTFDFPWTEVMITTGLALAAAVTLERLRPYRLHEEKPEILDVSAFESALAGQLETGQKIAYWETQDPAYMRLLSLLLPLVMFGAAVASWSSDLPASIILFVVGIVFPVFYGGLRVIVTRDRLVVKLGVLGVPLVRLGISQIAQAEVSPFSPLRDFGGYGIRINRRMKGYFFRGSRGVKITVSGQKKPIVIGSDNPERLAAVIQAIIR